jgi:hypothetical protein
MRRWGKSKVEGWGGFFILDLGFWIVEWGSLNRIKYGNREIGICEQLK